MDMDGVNRMETNSIWETFQYIPVLIWCQEQTGNSQNISLCFSSSISMPFSKLLASNKSYENLFLKRLLTPGCSRRKNGAGNREQVLGERSFCQHSKCLFMASIPVSPQEKGQTCVVGGRSSDIQSTSLMPLSDYNFWKGVWKWACLFPHVTPSQLSPQGHPTLPEGFLNST